ncbi:MAG TPA: hypothetical protein VEI04_03145 [Syntrophobacteria bacterium]|nr:hypothetical protein [Syntrophobacteria bacterium]
MEASFGLGDGSDQPERDGNPRAAPAFTGMLIGYQQRLDSSMPV